MWGPSVSVGRRELDRPIKLVATSYVHACTCGSRLHKCIDAMLTATIHRVPSAEARPWRVEVNSARSISITVAKTAVFQFTISNDRRHQEALNNVADYTAVRGYLIPAKI